MHRPLCAKAFDRSCSPLPLYPTHFYARTRAKPPTQRPGHSRSTARLVVHQGFLSKASTRVDPAHSLHPRPTSLRVLQLLELGGAFEISAIARMLDLPKETVRRTLSLLESEGRVSRSMGSMWLIRRARGIHPYVWALATAVAADRPATPLQPLAPEQRVLAALALGPFTAADLARALALPPEDLASTLAALVRAGLLRVAHRVEHSRRETLFSLANP